MHVSWLVLALSFQVFEHGYMPATVVLFYKNEVDEKESVMPEKPLQVRLEATDQRPSQFTLTFNSSQYSLTLNPEANVTFSDWLRRLYPVLMGQNDPAKELAPQALLRHVGTWLWQALLPDEAPAQERDALAQALRIGRTPLLLVLPNALAGLPWELLCDPEPPAEQAFLARRRPLIRFHPSDIPVSPLLLPLRVLLLISSPPGLGEDSRVDVESERAVVEQATREVREAGLLHLLVEDIVTPMRVQQALVRFKPHILHYIGHGGYDEKSGGVLLWEDDQGNDLALSYARLTDILRPRNLYAVVLHACETGRSNARTDIRSVADILVQEGIPAVIAQQANFSYESSQRASKAWYTALTAGQSFAEALLKVRQTLIEADRPDWAVPILQGDIASLTPMLATTSVPGPADPLLTSRGAATDLSTLTDSFVGRHRELRALCLMLESTPGSGPVLALITGPGGMGKSTLAAQAVTRYGRTYKAALTLSCEKYQGVDLFLQRIGEFLKRLEAPGFLEQTLPDPKLSIEAKIEEAIVALNGVGSLLLVIDNLDSVQNDDHTISDKDLLHLLQKLLTDLRGGRVLITGRYAVKELLAPGDFAANLLHLNLEDLSPYETNQLLLRHPALARLSEVVREMLVREFGGLPYVYNLLNSKGAIEDLEQIIYEVRNYGTVKQKTITKERKQHTAEEWQKVHHEVVEFTTLKIIINHLSEASRTLLAQLGVLHQSFPLAAIEQGLGVVRALWQPLLDWSLLHYDPLEQTYRLHSITRRYAEDLLDEPDRTQAQAQLAAWYEHYADRESHNLTDYLEAHRLWRAAGNVRQAGELVIQLAEALRRFGLYPLLRELCTTTLRGIRESDERLAAQTLNELGMIAYLQGDYPEARQLYGQSLEIFERLGDQSGRANSLHQLGMVAQQQGDYAEARQLYGQSLEIKERLGDQSGRANFLHQLGTIAQQQGDYAEMRQLYGQCLEIFERLGDQRGRASSLRQLGVFVYEQGDFEQALTYTMQAYILLDSLQSPSCAIALSMIARIRSHLDEATFTARWRMVAGDRPLPMLPDEETNQQLLQVVIDFIQAPTWNESKRFLESHLELLQPEVNAVLQALATQQEHDGASRTIEEHRLLLADCKDKGIEVAFAEHLGVKNPEVTFAAELDRICNEVVTTLRAGNGEQQEALATRLEQMLKDDLPIVGALDFLGLLVAWLRKQDTQALEEKLQLPFYDGYAQMVAAVEQEETENAEENDGLTVEELPGVVSSVILQGTTQQRQQLATNFVETQQQLPPEEATLGRFLGCLAAALRGETPEVALLEAPFTDVWQAFQDALRAASGEES